MTLNPRKPDGARCVILNKFGMTAAYLNEQALEKGGYER